MKCKYTFELYHLNSGSQKSSHYSDCTSDTQSGCYNVNFLCPHPILLTHILEACGIWESSFLIGSPGYCHTQNWQETRESILEIRKTRADSFTEWESRNYRVSGGNKYLVRAPLLVMKQHQTFVTAQFQIWEREWLLVHLVHVGIHD